MKLKLTVHFQQRLSERGIEIEHVKQAIRNPELTENVFEGRIVVQKNIGGKTIEVVYFKDGFRDKEEYICITARYLDSE